MRTKLRKFLLAPIEAEDFIARGAAWLGVDIAGR